MPTDESAPDGPDDAAAPAALPDEVLHLVYGNGLAVPPFSATLHQWFDVGTMLAMVPPSARGKGFGGVGFLVDALRDTAREAMVADNHTVNAVTMGGWNEYRIDVVRSVADGNLFPGGGRDTTVALTIASDGERQVAGVQRPDRHRACRASARRPGRSRGRVLAARPRPSRCQAAPKSR